MWLYLVLLGCAWVCESYPNGQVSVSCGDMTPSHMTSAQSSTAPFSVTTDLSSYKQGDTITVTLKATSGTFNGFLLEARLVGGNSPFGSFSLVGSSSQLLTCSGVSNSAVSHTTKNSKSQIQTKWKAPTSGTLNNIEFRATFVRSYSVFWVGVKSSQITYSGSSTSTSSSPAQGDTSSSSSTSTSSSAAQGGISSTGCGSTKTCVRQPADCDPSTTSACYFMSATPLSSDSVYTFEISGSASGYVAIGFSDDEEMGNDDIYICGKDTNGVIQLQHAFSTGTTTPTTIQLGNVVVQNASMNNGVISCSFTSSNTISTTRGSTSSNSYYMFIASGDTVNGVIQQHTTTPVISSTKVDLSNPQNVAGESETTPNIVKAHGCLMLISWMTTGTMGMLIARFMKRSCRGQRMCGKDIWFLVHVLLMLLSVAATIIAFILIFSYEKEWSGGAHPVLGVLVMILSLAQPIGTIFRCSPQNERRYIFNWIHFMNAWTIKALAVAAIFTGLMLIDTSASQWLPKVMGGFVAWEALLFLCQDIYFKSKQKDMDGSDGGVGSGVLLLMLFFIGNLAFLVALLVGIGIS